MELYFFRRKNLITIFMKNMDKIKKYISLFHLFDVDCTKVEKEKILTMSVLWLKDERKKCGSFGKTR